MTGGTASASADTVLHIGADAAAPGDFAACEEEEGDEREGAAPVDVEYLAGGTERTASAAETNGTGDPSFVRVASDEAGSLEEDEEGALVQTPSRCFVTCRLGSASARNCASCIAFRDARSAISRHRVALLARWLPAGHLHGLRLFPSPACRSTTPRTFRVAVVRKLATHR